MSASRNHKGFLGTSAATVITTAPINIIASRRRPLSGRRQENETAVRLYRFRFVSIGVLLRMAAWRASETSCLGILPDLQVVELARSKVDQNDSLR